MNKINLAKEQEIISKYKETFSIRKTAEALGCSIKPVIRVIKTCGEFQKINYRNYAAKSSEFKRIQLSSGIDKLQKPHIYNLWVETAPMRFYSYSVDKNMTAAVRTARLRKLQLDGDTFRFKEYGNLKHSKYWMGFGGDWQAKLTTQTCTIKVKLTGNDPLALMEQANDLVISKAQELHKRFGDMFRVNLGSPNLRFKTACSEFGLMSKEIHQQLKIMGFRAYTDGFNSIYIDRTPGKGLEMQGMDGSAFCSNFGDFSMWLAGGHKVEDLVTKDELFQAFGIYTENTLKPIVDKQQQSLNTWTIDKENRPSYLG